MCSIEEETWSRSSQFGSSIEIGAAHLGENTENLFNFCDAMWYIMCSIEVGASAIITVRRCNWNWSGALRWGNVLEHQRKCHKLSQHLNLTANGDYDDDVTIIIDQTKRMSNDIVHAKLLWQSAMAKGIEHESLCPCVSLNRYFLFSCFPTIFVNKWKRWSTMAKGIRHVSLCPCVRVMLPSLSFLPAFPTPASTLYIV